jgi:hypothetical protein
MHLKMVFMLLFFTQHGNYEQMCGLVKINCVVNIYFEHDEYETKQFLFFQIL